MDVTQVRVQKMGEAVEDWNRAPGYPGKGELGLIVCSDSKGRIEGWIEGRIQPFLKP